MCSRPMRVALGLALAVAVLAQDPIGGLSGSHTDIPRWCGKPYMKGAPNFEPGGMLYPPSSTPKELELQFRPHHSIYVSSESSAAFIVNASLPRLRNRGFGNLAQLSTNIFHFDVRLADSGEILLADKVEINAGASVLDFDLTCLSPRLEPYEVVLRGSLGWQRKSHQKHTATADLYYLPAKDTGSMVKVDNLNGGMLVANNVTDFAFQALLPFGFYTSCSDYLNYSLANVTAYKDLGFNAINPVCAFTDGDLSYLYDWMDESNLWYQYDMRNSYLNLSSVAEQIPLVKDRSAFLSWYTADEPDGWQYALNSTKLAYDLLKREDPYHPTGVVLNCQNYYFEEYAAGADYIMEDAYPVGINATFSRPYGIPCNDTYGDCGCDNCIGSLADVSMRLDDLEEYQQWLADWPKPLWAVLQAFSGEGYWSRDPTVQETWVMMLLGFNHRAKAMMSWTFPTSNVLAAAHGAMAKVVTTKPVKDFLLGGQPTAVDVGGSLDVAYWTQGEQVLLSVANSASQVHNGSVSFALPGRVGEVIGQPWGNLSYSVGMDGNVRIQRVSEFASSLALLQMSV